MSKLSALKVPADFLETLVREGQFSEVTKYLGHLSLKTVSREQLVSYANIANRVDRSQWALRLLNPIVRGRKRVPPTEAELVEYAESLRRVGAGPEALQILQKLDGEKFPMVYLRSAFCKIAEWDYRESIPYLKQYMAHSEVSDYSRLTAKVNLAAAYVMECMDEEALALLSELEVELKKSGHLLLLGNCLELTAHLFINKRDWTRADQSLSQASRLLPQGSSKFAFYIKKWIAFARGLQMQRIDPELIEIRKHAVVEKNWETVRECDLYMGLVENNRRLLQKVYMGTPFPSFRRKILRLAPDLEIPSEYIWSASAQPQKILNVLTAELSSGGPSDRGASSAPLVEQGGLPHRMLLALSRDFYRPLGVIKAVSLLFPNEHLNPFSSPNRIHQVLKRLREGLDSSKVQIDEDAGNYSLNLQDVGLRVLPETPDLDARSIEWKCIQQKLESSSFTKHDIIRANNCSPSSAKRILRWATDSGLIEVVGSGVKQHYRLAG